MSQIAEISSYIFAPFLAALYYTETSFILIAFLLLSIAFPLMLTLFDRKETLRRARLSIGMAEFSCCSANFFAVC